MANPTTNFGWVMPTSTSLVTNLPADFNTFGQAVDTSMAQLKGGTTGQILSKTSATDMAFTWITPNPGDITAVNVTSPITGGGSSGDVTIGIQAGSTTQSGAVQLTDSTSSTSTTTAATPNSVKTSYDLANAAIPKSTVTTNGDIIYGTGSGTVTRLGIGSSGQVLTVASGIPSWATPASTSTDVGCSIYKSANVTIADSTETLMTFNSEAWDTDNFHSTTTNTGRITIPTGKGGKYLVVIREYIQSNTSGQRLTRLQKNGTVDWTFSNPPVSGGVTVLSISLIMSLVATDYISYNVLQTSGGSLDYIGGTEGSIFQVTYLGA